VTAALLSALLVASPHGWTLQHARHVLTAKTYAVTDATQPDHPSYELRFSARSLRRGFVYDGNAYDTLTSMSIPVRFSFKPPGRIVGFRGPPADTSRPAFPIRAAFYYAWYPEAWWRDPVFPYSRYHPSLDYYSAADAHVVRDHTDALLYAHLNAGIYSWWGADGYPPTDLRFWRYLSAARTTPLRWALYYEWEGYADPSVDKIRADLEYIRDTYAAKPAYLKVDGRFVVYVYGNAGDGCATAARWRAANTVGAYIVLKAFAGFRDCAEQPDAWHQYSAALAEYDLLPDSFMIAPGFDERTESAPRLPRDATRWRADVEAMLASNARWQLVLSFNEWPEGTSVESAREWATPSGYGAYLDTLHELLP
jgi:hypothetical protein